MLMPRQKMYLNTASYGVLSKACQIVDAGLKDSLSALPLAGG